MHLLQYFDKLSLKPENAKQLKGLILDLAIRGRLTEEWRRGNPDSEPASVLLERIKEEKVRLIKEKKIRNEKTLPEILEDEIPFELPNLWEWTRIGNIGEVFNGNSISKSVKESKYNHVEEGYVYLGTKDIGYGFEEFNYKTGVIIPFDEPKFKIAKKGTVLICSEGGSAGKKCGISNENICFGNKLYAITPFIYIEPIYILSLYLSKSFQASFQERMTGIIGGISKNNFKDIPFPLPPLAEQKAIVKIVNQLMAEVDQLEEQTKTRVQLRQDFIQSSLRQLTTTDSPSEWNKLKSQFTSFFDTSESIDKLKEVILQLAVQGKLTKQWRLDNPDVEPASVLLEKIKEEKDRLIKEKKIKKEKPLPEITEEEIPFELPEGWAWCRLGEVSKQITDGEHQTPPRIIAGRKLLSAKNVRDGYIDYENCDYISEQHYQKSIKRCNPEIGDLLIVSVGGTIGRVSMITKDIPFALVRSVAIVKNQGLEPDYLRWVMNSPLLKEIIHSKKRGGAQPCLYLTEIRNFIFPIAPLDEQKGIVEIVNEIIDFCDQMKMQIENRNTLSKDFLRSSIREVMEKTKSLA